MKVLIVDDEAPARQRLRRVVEEIEGYEITGDAATGRQALLQCDQQMPDIVLMDIRMPEMDGLEAARHLARMDQAPAVIFTTAYGDHALAAFEAQAVDYVLKPVRKQRLLTALARARRLSVDSADQLVLDESVQARTHICAQVRGSMHLIPVSDIACFLASDKYVTVCHSGGEVLIDEPLKKLEQEFTKQFVRVHRNALVSPDFVAGLEKDAQGRNLLRLRDVQACVEVSRRNIADIRKWLKQGKIPKAS